MQEARGSEAGGIIWGAQMCLLSVNVSTISLLLPLDKLANHFMKICSYCDYGYSFCPNGKPFISNCFVCCCIVSRFDICVWEMVIEISNLVSLPSSRMRANYYQCFICVLTMTDVLYWPEITVCYSLFGQFGSKIKKKGYTFQADMRSDHCAV